MNTALTLKASDSGTPSGRFDHLTRTMPWLIRKELWENKGSLVRVPVVIGAIIALLSIVGLLVAQTQAGRLDAALLTQTSKIGQGVDALAMAWPLIGMPILLAMGLTVFSFSLGTLFDERHDRSVMFWKSLPLSDGAVVASKAAMALLVAPLIAVSTVLVVSLFGLIALCLASIAHGVNLFGVFALPQTYGSALSLVALVPVYALAALPTVGWLMLVGAAAPSKPFLWAILLPLGLVMAGWIVGASVGLEMGWTGSVASHLLLGTVPGSWLAETAGEAKQMSGWLTGSLRALTQPSLWIGAMGGLAMLSAATWVRKRHAMA